MAVDYNGLFFNNVRLPEEILVEILVYIEAKHLLTCRRVCLEWKRIIDSFVWKRKELSLAHASRIRDYHLSVKDYYRVNVLQPFGRNLIKNPCGIDEFAGWDIVTNGGDHWAIETTPQGANPLPRCVGLTPCFVTSYSPCSKIQIINLNECGITPKIMDFIKPEFHISEWYCGRFDCCSYYKLGVILLNQDKREIGEPFHFSTQTHHGPTWLQVKTVFKDYPPGVRFIWYNHEGADTQYWAGHYGSKMTAATVICCLPTK